MKRVLIVDDSPAACELLKKLINSFEGFSVCGIASDAFSARDQIKAIKPDLITLDVQMPKMDGITFLHSLMRNKPLPTLMISSMTTDGAIKTLEALDVGAIDYIPKPKIENEQQLAEFTKTLEQKLHHVAHIPNAYLQSKANQLRTGKAGLIKRKMPVQVKSEFYSKLICLCSGSGGTDAIRQILETLSPDIPGVIIHQQLPKSYIESFASRLTETTGFQTKVITNGEIVMPGQIYVCPIDQIVSVKNDGKKLTLHTRQKLTEEENSIDALLSSVAESIKTDSMCVFLTGTGEDGIEGITKIKELGGKTLGQDKESSVIWQRVESANKAGLIDEILPLRQIAGRINSIYQG